MGMKKLFINDIDSYFIEELSASIGIRSDQIADYLSIIASIVCFELNISTKEHLTEVLESTKRNFPDLQLGILPDQASLDQSKANDLLFSIFNETLYPTIAALSNYLDITNALAVKLMGIIAPAVLLKLTEKGKEWNPDFVRDVLRSQERSLTHSVPEDLGLEIFGSIYRTRSEFISSKGKSRVVEPIHDAASPNRSIDNQQDSEHKSEILSEKEKVDLWWISVPILLLLTWFIIGRSCDQNTTPLVDTLDRRIDSTDNDVEPLVNDNIKLMLPDGELIEVDRGRMEDNFLKFLQSDYEQLTDAELKDVWFDFDYVAFEHDQAIIQKQSEKQLMNIAAILKNFPDVKIKIAGYTDRTERKEFNKHLSFLRAAAVEKVLTGLGVGAQIKEVQGYGAEFAQHAQGAEEEERVKDRRVALSLYK